MALNCILNVLWIARKRTRMEERCEHTNSRLAKCFFRLCFSVRTNGWSKANEIKILAPTTKTRQYRWRLSAAASLRLRCRRRRRLGRSQHTILTTLDEGAHVVLKNLVVVCACCVFQSIAFEMCAPYVTHEPIHTDARATVLLLARSFVRMLHVCVNVCLFGICAFLFSFTSSCYCCWVSNTACC